MELDIDIRSESECMFEKGIQHREKHVSRSFFRIFANILLLYKLSKRSASVSTQLVASLAKIVIRTFRLGNRRNSRPDCEEREVPVCLRAETVKADSYQFSRTFHHAVDILELGRKRNDATSSVAETFAPKEQKKCTCDG